MSEALVNTVPDVGQPAAELLQPRITTRDAGLQQYLRDLGRPPILSRTEATALSDQIQTGLQAEAMLAETDPRPSALAQIVLRHSTQQGRQARNELVGSNLRLVVKLANQYAPSPSTAQDLIQAGNEWLLKIVGEGKFDPSKGSFSNFATLGLSREMRRENLEISGPMHIPDEQQRRIHNVAVARTRLRQELGRSPTDEELSASTDVSLSRIRLYNQYRPRRTRVSLDALLVDEEHPRQFPDKSSDTEALITSDAMAQRFGQIWAKLSPEQRATLTIRFGAEKKPDDYDTAEADQALSLLRHPSFDPAGDFDDLFEDGEWRSWADCRQVGPEPFFSRTTQQAKTICQDCAVVDECENYYQRVKPRSGMWGYGGTRVARQHRPTSDSE